MSVIRRIIDNLNDTEAVGSRLDEAARQNPDDEILRINAESIAKRRADLMRKLDYELRTQQHDFVGYSIMRRSERYPALAVGRSVVAFQELITSIFDALRSAPKLRYRPNPENLALSSLEFAAARSGSVAVALHIPNERLMLAESDLDQTFQRLFRILAARKQEEFRDLVPLVGVSSLTKAYTWADISTIYGLDTSIRWGKTVRETKDIAVSHTDALVMREAIDATSDEHEETKEYDCLLEGIDPVASYFHVILLDGTSIKGETSDSFPHVEWTTRKHYRAFLSCKTVIKFASGEEKITWTLRDLIPI